MRMAEKSKRAADITLLIHQKRDTRLAECEGCGSDPQGKQRPCSRHSFSTATDHWINRV